MERQINLLGQSAKKTVSGLYSVPLFGGSILLFIVVIFASLGVGIYSYILNREKEVLAIEIANLEQEKNTLKEVEEKKSIVTIKADELKRIYDSRFDYVKAIDDIQKMFSYTLEIESIELNEDKTATVVANKTGNIVISESQALATDIEELELQLKLPSSEELQETVDNLRSYLGQGLRSADVKESFKLEEESGYQVNFSLTFGSLDKVQPSQSGIPATQ